MKQYTNGHADPGRNRGGKCHKANSDGSGGRSKGSPSSDSLARHGVTHATEITETPKELGMATTGMSEKPMGVAKHPVDSDRGKFRFR